MSGFRDARRWLEDTGIYPAPGLADALWSSDRQLLAIKTRAFDLLLYRVGDGKQLWSAGPDVLAMGWSFRDEVLVVRRVAPPTKAGRASVTVKVERDDNNAGVQIVGPDQPCRTYGVSHDCRFQLVRQDTQAALLDLAQWDEASPGIYPAELAPISRQDNAQEISFAWISPCGGWAILRYGQSGGCEEDCFVSLLGDSRGTVLPDYPWADPRYLWSPDGCWIAATIAEETPANWDEIPVGAPDLKSYIALYNGHTGQQIWSEEVDTIFAPFEWLEDGRLEAANRIWNPENGTTIEILGGE